jgi:hypothetical protein
LQLPTQTGTHYTYPPKQKHATVEEDLAAAKQDLAVAKEELAVAKKELAVAKKELAVAKADAEQALDGPVREINLIAWKTAVIALKTAQEGVVTAQTAVTTHQEFFFRKKRRDQQRPVPVKAPQYDATSIYVPHETFLRDVWDQDIPNIRPIPMNRGQISLPSTTPRPWTVDSKYRHILEISEGKSCQISLAVLNFLTNRRRFQNEPGVQPLVNFFTEIVVEVAALGECLQQERDTHDPSSTSESTGSNKPKKFRPDSIIVVKGVTLVRIEEKKDQSLLKNAQHTLVDKLSLDWLVAHCNAPFIIGIAVAGNIWTFHRITADDVIKCGRGKEKNIEYVPKTWFSIDTAESVGRLYGLQAAVHIASLLRLFANLVHGRSVPFEIHKTRKTCKIFITQKGNPHVQKSYVS